MQVRNKRTFDVFLPYAGPQKGKKLCPNELSPNLPTDRFYDPLLQRDWKRGCIEVVLDEMDQAVLGPNVSSMFKFTPAKPDNTNIPPQVKKEAGLVPPTKSSESPPAVPVQPVEPEQPAVDSARSGELPDEDMDGPPEEEVTPMRVIPQASVMEAFAKEAKKSSTAIKRCDCCDKTTYVEYVKEAGLNLCGYCRRSIRKNKNRILEYIKRAAAMAEKRKKEAPENFIPVVPPVDDDYVPESQASAEAPQEERAATPPGMPHTPPPQRQPSLADLMQINAYNAAQGPALGQAKQEQLDEANKLLGGPMGSPLHTMSKPHPDNRPIVPNTQPVTKPPAKARIE